MLHDRAQRAQLRQTTGDVQEPFAFRWCQVALDEQKAILEQVTDFLLDILALRANRRASLSLDDGRPRFNFGLDVAKRSRSLATALKTPWVSSLMTWKVQS